MREHHWDFVWVVSIRNYVRAFRYQRDMMAWIKEVEIIGGLAEGEVSFQYLRVE